jgi:20S proteasome subunit beta 4
MESLIGIVGADFILLAADRVAARSIVVMKGEEDKFRSLSPHVVMAYSGEPGDTVNFAEYIKRNVQLYMIKNDLELGTEAAAHYTRRELADSLRSRVRCDNAHHPF